MSEATQDGSRAASHLIGTLVGIVVVTGIGSLDFWTGSDWGFSLFYLLPIVVASWWLGLGPGTVLAASSALGWFLAEVGWEHNYSFLVSV
jgi:hypothetical protein